jgi:hypothetical protein
LTVSVSARPRRPAGGCSAGHDEQRVRQLVSPRGFARRLGHARRVGVDADYEGVGALGGRAQHMPCVAGAQVDGDLGVLGCLGSGLAVVPLVERAALDGAHGG